MSTVKPLCSEVGNPHLQRDRFDTQLERLVLQVVDQRARDAMAALARDHREIAQMAAADAQPGHAVARELANAPPDRRTVWPDRQS